MILIITIILIKNNSFYQQTKKNITKTKNILYIKKNLFVLNVYNSTQFN